MEPVNAFLGKSNPPSQSELAKALGITQQLWDALLKRLATEHKLTNSEWNSYSKKSGWALRIKHGDRNIVYLSPCLGGFKASFALGEKAVQAAKQAGLPNPILKLINEAKCYAEGRAVRLEIKSEADIEIVSKLAKAKMNN